MRLRPVWIVLFLILAVSAPAAVRAQAATMDAAVAQVADELSKSRQTSLVVFDFAGPDGKMTALGQKLADDFSSALSRAGRKLHVEDRSRIAEVISKGQYAPDVIHIPTLDITLASDMKVKAFASGVISLQGQELKVLVKCKSVKDSKTIVSSSFSLTLTEGLAPLVAATTAEAPIPPYMDMDSEDSPPHCTYCPNPTYADEAAHRRIQGAVILEVWSARMGSFQICA